MDELTSERKQHGALRVRRIDGGSPGALDRADLQTILDSFPFYVMLVDASHHILLANEAVRVKLDVAPELIVGGYCPKVVHGVEGRYPGCPLEDSVARGGCSVECDLWDEKTDHVYRSAIYPTPYETEEGLAVFLHTTQDITEQRRAEERERRTIEVQRAVNELLRVAIEPLPLADLLRRILELSASISWLGFLPQGAVFVFDAASAQLVMRASVGLDPAVEEACARVPHGSCLCGRAAATRETLFAGHVDERHIIDHGAMAPHGHYCVPIEQEGAVLGVLNIYVEEGHEYAASEVEFLQAVARVLAGIIQRRRAEELREAHERVALSRGRMARVGELAAGVAHTIRNPLHGLLNCVEILRARTSGDDTVASEILPLMSEGLVRIDRVTRRLLSLTRDVKLEPRPTDMADLLDDVRRLLAGHAEERGVRIAVESAALPEVFLDPERVGEALANVMSNAIDASRPGGVVSVRAEIGVGSEKTLVVEVEDRGEGIPVEDLPRVLDPFFTTKPVGEGSGLGLAIARQVMEEHEGRVDIESEAGVGTTVRLSFPLPPSTSERRSTNGD